MTHRYRSTLAGIGVLFALGTSRGATADETSLPPLSRSAIGEDMASYYGSEKSTTFTMMSFGGLSVVAGVGLVTRPDVFSHGLGWSMLSLGALAGIGGITYLFTVNSEIDSWSKRLASDPAGFKKDEAEHIRGTMSRFVFYRIAELVALAVGIGCAVYGFAAQRDVFQGIGIGVGLESGLLFTVDTLGNRRAEDYEAQLGRFDVSVALQPAQGGAWSFAAVGRF